MAPSKNSIWVERLDALAVTAGSYKKVAELLGVSSQMVSKARTGKQELPGPAKARLLVALGLTIERADYISLFPPKDREAASKSTSVRFPPKRAKKTSPSFWADRINDLQDRFKVKTDAELARKLGISTSNLSLARTGQGNLSPRTKFTILDKLSYAVTRDLVIDLLPPKTAEKLRDVDNLRFGKE